MRAWITALLLCLPPTLLESTDKSKCIHAVNSPLVITFGYPVPLVIVIFCYSSILKGLYFDRKILAEIVIDEARLREKKCLVRGRIVITLMFLAYNLPKIVIIYDCNKQHQTRYIALLTLECLYHRQSTHISTDCIARTTGVRSNNCFAERKKKRI